MRTVVTMVLNDPFEDEPIAELRMENPTIAPAIFDFVQFDPEAEHTTGDLCGRVTCRVFRFLPHCIEIDIIAEALQ